MIQRYRMLTCALALLLSLLAGGPALAAAPIMEAEPAYTAGLANKVSWSKSTDPGGPFLYQVQRSSSPEFSAGLVASPWQAGLSYEFTGLADGVQYWYRVRGKDAAGNVRDWSAEVSSTQDNRPPPVPAMEAEPSYTDGLSNSVSWTAVTDPGAPVRYQVQRSTSSGFAAGLALSSWRSGLSYEFIGLSDGVQYWYRVKSKDAAGNESAWSAAVSSTQDDSAPAAPVLDPKPAYNAGLSALISWSAVADPAGPVQYLAELATSADFQTGLAASAWQSGLDYEFSDLRDGVRYWYRVKAKDVFGYESAWSIPLNSTQDNAAPSAPVMEAEPAYTRGLSNTISWSAVSDASGSVQYLAECATSSDFGQGLAAGVWQSGLGYEFTGLKDGVQYWYRVKARDAVGNESVSSEAVSSAQDNAAPAAPVMKSEPAYTPGLTNTVSWAETADPSGSVSYQAQLATSPSFTAGLIATPWQSGLSYEFTGLSDGAQYWYRARAKDATGNEGVWSAPATSIQDNASPPVPAMTPEPAFAAGLSNTASWTAVTDPSGPVVYLIQQSTSPDFTSGLSGSPWQSGLSYEFTKLGDGVRYWYRVKARDVFGHESLWSAAVSCTQDNSAPPVPAMDAEPAYTAGLSNKVSWRMVLDPSEPISYQVQCSTSADFAGGLAASPWQSALSCEFTGLSDGVRYWYRVKAVDAAGFESAWSAAVSSIQDNAPPSAPVMDNEPAYTEGLSNLIFWNEAADPSGPVLYQAQRSESPDFTAGLAAASWQSWLSCEFDGLGDGIRYWYRVRAKDVFGHESAWSAAVSSIQDNAAPAAPLMGAEPAYTTGLANAVSWSAVADPSGPVLYQVQRAISTGFGSGSLSSPWQPGLAYEFTGLNDGVQYWYRVRAKDVFDHESAWSPAVHSTQDNAAPPPPAMEAEPAYTAGIANTVSWSPITDPSGPVRYQVQRSTSAGFAVGLAASPWQSGSRYEFTGLSDGVRYWYRVKASDAAGNESGWSAAISSTQDDASPPAPVMTAAPAFTAGLAFRASWSETGDPSGSVRYQVQRSASAVFANDVSASPWLSGLTYEFTGLADSVRYWYRIRAMDAVGNQSPWSEAISSTQDNAAPAAPVMLGEPSYTAGLSNPVFWREVTDPGGSVQYQAQRGTSAAFDADLASSPWQSGLGYEFTGLKDGTKYWYRVKARDPFGHESTWSEAVGSVQDNTPPSVPVIEAEPDFTAGLSNRLTWNEVTDPSMVVEYLVEISASPAFGGGVSASSWLSRPGYEFTGLSDGVRYWYRVKARDAVGNLSAWSAPVSSTQDNEAPPAPVMDTEPAYTSGLSNKAFWGEVSDPSGGVLYQVQRSTAEAFTTGLTASPWLSGLNHEFTGLTDGVRYWYRAKAVDAVGNESAWSVPVSSTQDNAPPPVPVIETEPTYTAGLSNAVSWKAVTDPSGPVQYRVEISTSPTAAGGGSASSWQSGLGYEFTGLSDGVRYWYRVKSRDKFGHESVWSAAVSSTQDNSPPRAPVMEAEPPITAGLSNTIAWGVIADPSGVIQYLAQFSSTADFAEATAAGSWQSARQVELTGLRDGVRYWYRVKARDALGQESEWSAAVSSIQDNTAPPSPVMESEPSHTAGLANTVAWKEATDPAGPVRYQVERSTSPDFTAGLAAGPWQSGLRYEFAGLADGAQYWYRVKAMDAVGNTSAWSAAVSSTQDNAPPPVPVAKAKPAYTAGLANTIEWSAVADPSGPVQYLAEVSTSSGFASGLIASPWQSGLSYRFAGLSDGVRYWYRVRARDGFGHESAWSASVFSAQDDAAPAAPAMEAEPAYTAGLSNAISWKAVTDPSGAVQYQVERANSPDFGSGSVTSPWQTGLRYEFAGLSEGLRYWYRVKAMDAVGNIGDWSTGVNSIQDNTAPAAPILAAEPAFTAGLANAVSWSEVTDPSGSVLYQVELAASAGFAGSVQASPWQPGLDYEFGGLSDGVRYWYRVKTKDAVGNVSAWSAAVSSVQDDSPPSVPVMEAEPGFTAGLANRVAWKGAADPSGAVQYQVQRAEAADFGAGLAASPWQSGLGYEFTGLRDGVQYWYRVRARDGLGHLCAWSAAVSSTQDDAAPAVPVMDAEPPHSPGLANTVSWSAAADPSGPVLYQVERADSADFGTGLAASTWQSGLSYEFTGLNDGVRYWYRAKARDGLGHESEWSASVDSGQDNAAPPAPVMAAEPAHTAGLANTVSWSAVPDPSDPVLYQVQYSTSSNFAADAAAGPWQSGLSYEFAGLRDGVQYWYRVKARDDAGNVGIWSAAVSSAQDDRAPSVPVMSAEPAFAAGLKNTVSWSAAADPSGPVQYLVQSAGASDFGRDLIASPWQSGLSYEFSGLSDGSRYWYRVKAKDIFGHETAWSASVSSTQDDSAPSPPVMADEPAYTAGLANTVSWSAVTDPAGSVQYQVQRATSADFAAGLAAGPWQSGLSYEFAGLGDNVQYWYRVKARDALGHESEWSAAVSSTPDNTAPPAPAMAAEPAMTGGLANLVSWGGVTDPSGPVQYQVQGAVSAEFRAGLIAGPWQSGLRYEFTGLSGGQRYWYRVRARDVFGHESAWSAAVSSTQDDAAPPAPAMSPEPAHTAGLANQIFWSSVSDPSGPVEYQAQLAGSPGFAEGAVASAWISGTSYDFTGLSDGVRYWYRVRARDAFGHESPWSAPVSSTQDNAAPPVPIMEAEPAYSAGLANLVSWSGVADPGGPVQYQVQCADSDRFEAEAVSSPWQIGPNYEFTGLDDGVRYWYRVKARDGFGHESAWSESTSSTQDNAAPPPPAMEAEPAYTAGLANRISWTGVTDPSGAPQYQAQRSTSAGFKAGLAASPWLSGLEYEFAGLKDGVQYWYRVRARDGLGQEGAWSDAVSSTQDNASPAVPMIEAEPAYTAGLANLVSWSEVMDPSGSVQYQAESSLSAGFAEAAPGPWQSGTSYEFSGLSDGIHYWYRVRAKDVFGHASEWSAPVSSTQDNTAPSPPILAAEPSFSAGQTNTVYWDEVIDASGPVLYWAERADSPEFTSIAAAGFWQADPSGGFSDLDDGIQYWYRVKAKDGAGNESAWSAAVSSAQDNSAPTAPAMEDEPAYTPGLANEVFWSATADPSGPVQYQVQCADSPAFTGGRVDSGWQSSRRYEFTGLGDGIQYWYRVRARDTFGHEGAWSAAISSVQDNAAPAVPAINPEPEFTAGISNMVTWSEALDLSGPVQYQAEISLSPDFATGVVASPWQPGLNYEFTGLSEGVTYWYRVRARDGVGHESAWSEAVSSTQESEAAPPSA